MANGNVDRVGRVGQRRQVVIPQGICEALDLAVGDFVAIEECAGMVVIRPQKVTDREEGVGPREAAAVRRGIKDARAGSVVAWRDYKRKHGVRRKAR